MRVLRESKKTDTVTAKSILYQAYETAFGIHDYLDEAMQESVQPNPDKKRPLSSVGMHFAEDFSSTSKLYEMIRIFKDRKVFSVMGLNLTEFLDLPHDVCEYILIECSKQQQQEAVVAQQVMGDLTRMR